MKTKTKIAVVLAAVVILAAVLYGGQTGLFQGSMGKIPFPKGGELPADTRRIEKPIGSPVKTIDLGPLRTVIEHSVSPATIDPTRGEMAVISYNVNSPLPDGLSISIQRESDSQEVFVVMSPPVGVSSNTVSWDGRAFTEGSPIVTPGRYKYIFESGTRFLNQGIITVSYVPVVPSSSLTLIKNVVGGTSTVADFPLFIGTTSVVSGVANSVPAGDYIVSERTRPGYMASPWSGDCSAEGRVSIRPGENKTCLIINNYVSVVPAPTLRHWVSAATIDPSRGENATIFYDIVGTFEAGLNILIRDSGGRNVKVIGSSTTPVSTGDYSVTWNGRNSDGVIVPNGSYQYVFVSGGRELSTGNVNVAARPVPAPTLRHRVSTATIDPSRGENATIFYDIVGTFDAGLNILIRDSGGRNVKVIGSSTTPVSTGDYSVTWDGRNSDGVIVPDGVYQYVFVSGGRELSTGNVNVVVRPISVGTSSLNISVIDEYQSRSGIRIAGRPDDRYVAIHTLTATGEEFIIRDLDLQLAESSYEGDPFDTPAESTPRRSIATVILSNGGESRSALLDDDGVARFRGLEILVPTTGTSAIVISMDTTTISEGARTGDKIRLGISTAPGYRFRATGVSSGGEINTIRPMRQYRIPTFTIRKSMPIVSRALSSIPSNLFNGTVILYGIHVRAEGGPVSLKRINFGIGASLPEGATLSNFKFYRGTTVDLSSQVSILTVSGLDAETNDILAGTTSTWQTLEVTFDDTPAREEVVAEGVTNTYYLEATVSGARTGSNVTTNISDDSSFLIGNFAVTPADLETRHYNFIWSDQGIYGTAHSTTTLDWTNGSGIDSLPTQDVSLSY